MALIELKNTTNRILTSFNNLVTGILETLNPNGSIKKIFGNWEAKNLNTIYQAQTDGLVTAFAVTIGVGYEVTLQGVTDINSPPSIARTRDSAFYTAGFGNVSAGITMPVKKNHYWRVEMWKAGVLTTSAVYWLPIGE